MELGGATTSLSPSPTTPTVARTATTVSEPDPTPAPILGQRQTVKTIAGKVTVRLKGTKQFVSLPDTGTIPDGSEVDATHGHVVITAATLIPGQTKSAEAFGGRFLIHQDRTGPGETRLTLSLPLTGCPRVKLPGSSVTVLATSAKHGSGSKSRHLWVSDNGGSWGTNGRYVSTTVEGTRWLTVDQCDKSRVTVATGRVKVHNLIDNTTKLLTTGETYVA
jgi:hypothetical protein